MSPISLLFATIGMFTPLAEAGGPKCLKIGRAHV